MQHSSLPSAFSDVAAETSQSNCLMVSLPNSLTCGAHVLASNYQPGPFARRLALQSAMPLPTKKPASVDDSQDKPRRVFIFKQIQGPEQAHDYIGDVYVNCGDRRNPGDLVNSVRSKGGAVYPELSQQGTWQIYEARLSFRRCVGRLSTRLVEWEAPRHFSQSNDNRDQETFCGFLPPWPHIPRSCRHHDTGYG